MPTRSRAKLGILAGLLTLTTFAIFSAGCSSDPKIYNVGGSASRITIQEAE